MCLGANTCTLGAWYVKASLGAKTMLNIFPQTKVTNEATTEVFTVLRIYFSSLKILSILYSSSIVNSSSLKNTNCYFKVSILPMNLLNLLSKNN